MFADNTNSDIVEVMEVVGSDKRIGKCFFEAGRGYGGTHIGVSMDIFPSIHQNSSV